MALKIRIRIFNLVYDPDAGSYYVVKDSNKFQKKANYFITFKEVSNYLTQIFYGQKNVVVVSAAGAGRTRN